MSGRADSQQDASPARQLTLGELPMQKHGVVQVAIAFTQEFFHKRHVIAHSKTFLFPSQVVVDDDDDDEEGKRCPLSQTTHYRCLV